MAGYTVIAGDVQNKAGGIITSLWDSFDQCHRFKLWLDDSDHNDTYLQTTLGMSSADTTIIRAAFADLGSATNGLYAVGHGIFVPAGVNNFFFNARKLTGTNYTG